MSNVFHLHKLHGSVDWGYVDGRVVRKRVPEHPVIIYPRYTKFEQSYYPPFFEMVARFQSLLRQPNTGLLIVGFGFQDNHVVQPILAAVRANVKLTAMVVGPTMRVDEPGSPRAFLNSLILNGDSRLMLGRMSFEELVPLIPNLVSDTHDEQHEQRMRAQA